MVSLPDQWLLPALREGDLDLAQAALQTGAKPNLRGPDGERPLTAAARWAKASGLVKGLLERGARVDGTNGTWHTPRMFCGTRERR